MRGWGWGGGGHGVDIIWTLKVRKRISNLKHCSLYYDIYRLFLKYSVKYFGKVRECRSVAGVSFPTFLHHGVPKKCKNNDPKVVFGYKEHIKERKSKTLFY